MNVWKYDQVQVQICFAWFEIWFELVWFLTMVLILDSMTCQRQAWFDMFLMFFCTIKICTHVAVKKSNNICYCWIPISLIHPAWQQLQSQCRFPHIMASLRRMVSMSLIPFWGPPNAPAFPGSHSPWCCLFFDKKVVAWNSSMLACFLKIQSYSRTHCFPTNHLSFHVFSWKNRRLFFWRSFQAPNVFSPCRNQAMLESHLVTDSQRHHIIVQYFRIFFYMM